MDRDPDKYPRERVKEATLVKRLDTAKMAFRGEFEKLDDEIKV